MKIDLTDSEVEILRRVLTWARQATESTTMLELFTGVCGLQEKVIHTINLEKDEQENWRSK